VLLRYLPLRKRGIPNIAGKTYKRKIMIVLIVPGISIPILSIRIPKMIVPANIDPAQNLRKNQLKLIPLSQYIHVQLNQSGDGKTNKYHRRMAFLRQ